MIREEYGRVFEIVKYLIDNKIKKINIYDLFMKVFNIDFSEINNIKDQLNKVIPCDDYISLTLEIVSAYEQIPYFLAHFYNFKKYDIESLIFKLESCLEKYNNIDDIKDHFIYISALIYAIEFKDNLYSEDDYVAMFLYNLLSLETILSNASKQINILDEFKNTSINILVTNSNLIKLYKFNKIETFAQLIKSPLIYKVVLFIINHLDTKYYFNYLTIDAFKDLIEKIDFSLNTLTPKEEKLLKLRYGINDGNRKTLEELGSLFSLTRERVRQIISKAERRLLHPQRIGQLKSICNMYYMVFKHSNNFVVLDSFSNYLSLTEQFMFIACLEIFNIAKYNTKYNYVIDFDANIDDVINDIIESLEELISYEDFNNYSLLEQNIIKRHYKDYGNVYVKSTLNKTKICKSILVDNYNGEFDSKSDVLDEINEILENKYFISGKIELHSFLAIISRAGFYPIGKGIYKNCEDFPIISEDLLNDIVEYIDSFESAVAYSTLFLQFKEDLESLGINNSYYLKSVIDVILKDDYRSTKDYLYKKDASINVVQYLTNELRKFQGPFEIRDIMDKYPQYSKISIGLLIDRELKKDLLQFDLKKYIYFKDVNISDDIKGALFKIVEDAVNKNNGTASVNSIFVDMYYNHYDLLSKLGLFNSAFGLYSIIKILFKDDFNFHRPLVFDKSISKMNNYILLNKKIGNYNEVTFDDLRNISSELQVTVAHSKLQYVDVICDNFMMVDQNRFINKRIYTLSNSMINDIKLILNLYLKKEKELDTERFNLYNLFPKLKYKWNKYLLLGFIKTYLNSDYDIIYKVELKKYDFIVRRLIDE